MSAKLIDGSIIETKQKYQVAVIIYTYNSDLKKTLGSIRSAVLQTGVLHQIVVGDDGSDNNHREEIEELFHKLNFSDFSFSLLECNQGVTENLRQASCLVQAEYIKILSPGDYLSEADVLARLYAFMQSGNHKVCFGDAIYYRNENGNFIPIKDHINAPRLLYPYDSDRKRAQFTDCLVLNDFILGAAVFTETDTYKEYINRLSGHVKYFEDNALRLMVYDGISVRHFPEVIMWYEYGSGISTSHSEYWLRQLKRDYNEANILMVNKKTGRSFLKVRIGLVYAMNKGISSIRFIIFPEAVPRMIQKQCLMEKAPYGEPGVFLRYITTSKNYADEKI